MMEIKGDAMTIAGVNAGKYIASIRNRAKKDYARRYLLHILKGRKGAAPSSNAISKMASQAVRLRLDQIFQGTSL
jgi:hypothetical protein